MSGRTLELGPNGDKVMTSWALSKILVVSPLPAVWNGNVILKVDPSENVSINVSVEFLKIIVPPSGA